MRPETANQTRSPPPPGSYSLDSLLGSGGMGEVWLGRAWFAKGLSQRRAIKRLLPNHTSDVVARRRFFGEAKASLQLQHPNIVQVYDFTEIDGRECLVMEWVQGGDLAQLLAYCRRVQLPFPKDVAVYVAVQTLKALDYVHNFSPDGVTLSGLCHRDISPHNILLSRSGEVKLSDFGIARLLDSTITAEGPKGKLAYMAPEQLHKKCDARVDLYSVGVVLFEMLAGDRYLHSGTKNQTEERSLVVEQLQLAGVPIELSQIVATLVQHDVDARYANARIALRALVHCQPTPSADTQKKLAALVAAAFRPSQFRNITTHCSDPSKGNHRGSGCSSVARKILDPTAGASQNPRPKSKKIDTTHLESLVAPAIDAKESPAQPHPTLGIGLFYDSDWIPKILFFAIPALICAWYLIVSQNAGSKHAPLQSGTLDAHSRALSTPPAPNHHIDH